MIRVHIVVEGQTEESFINELLYFTFIENGIHLIPHKVGKGGIVGYGPVKRDILNFLKGEKGSYCTTMIDFFHLPPDFPGMPVDKHFSTKQKAAAVEKAIAVDIGTELDGSLRPDRFFPYVQMHEFEGLLFSDPSLFAQGIYRDDLTEEFKNIRDSFKTPEDIDDENAPSYRIKELLPEYKKITFGVLAALKITLQPIREQCNHFNQWLSSIEGLGGEF